MIRLCLSNQVIPLSFNIKSPGILLKQKWLQWTYLHMGLRFTLFSWGDAKCPTEAGQPAPVNTLAWQGGVGGHIDAIIHSTGLGKIFDVIMGVHVKEKLEISKQQWMRGKNILPSLCICKVVAVGDNRLCLDSFPQPRHPRPADRPQSDLLFPLQMSVEDKVVAAVEGAELMLPNRSTSCRLLPCWPRTPTTTETQGTVLQCCQHPCKLDGKKRFNICS